MKNRILICVIFATLSIIVGIGYIALLSGKGNIEVIFGEVSIVPLVWYLEIIEKYGVKLRIGYGFIIFSFWK